VKVVAKLRLGVLTETEVVRIECGEHAALADLGLQLAQTIRLAPALQARSLRRKYPRWVSGVAAVRFAGAGWRVRASIP